MASNENDVETAEQFGCRMTDVVQSGFLLSGLSIGVELNLFNVMKDASGPMSSHALAEKSDCKERYVREWLHQMVASDVIDVDATGTLFTFPEHRHAALTSRGQPVEGFSTVYAHMMGPHAEIIECFRKTGPPGLPFAKVDPMLRQIWKHGAVPNYSLFCDIIENCADNIKAQLESGIRVLDIGCGTGTLILELAVRFPKSQFVGYDMMGEYVQQALKARDCQGVTNVEFFQQDCTELPGKCQDSFDFAFSRHVMHDIPFPEKAMAFVHGCLKPGGSILIIEFSVESDIYTRKRSNKEKFELPIFLCISIYHCLVSSMNTPGSKALGCQVMNDCIKEAVKCPGFKLVRDFISSTEYCLLLEKVDKSGQFIE